MARITIATIAIIRSIIIRLHVTLENAFVTRPRTLEHPRTDRFLAEHHRHGVLLQVQTAFGGAIVGQARQIPLEYLLKVLNHLVILLFEGVFASTALLLMTFDAAVVTAIVDSLVVSTAALIHCLAMLLHNLAGQWHV